MTILSRHMLPLVTVAAIGLVGSAVIASAQAPAPTAPPPLRCEPGYLPLTVLHGKIDNFAGGADNPAPAPSNALKQAYPPLVSQAATNVFDSANNDYWFGDTLLLSALPNGATIGVARLSTRLKPNGTTGASSSGNDTITLLSGTTKFGYSIKDLVPNSTSPKSWGNNNPSQAGGVDFVFTMTNTINQSPSSPSYPSGFLATLATNKSLDVLVQDDTGVDYLQLDICYKPTPKYDLVATKKHDGNIYILDVTNTGSPIMPTGSVQVVEVVPVGLTIDSASATGWTCPGVNFPVVGPDSFVCNFPIPPGGIATNAHLPQIVLKTEGKPECPNCMRARLFLRNVSDGTKPVDEGDMKNNVSCAK